MHGPTFKGIAFNLNVQGLRCWTYSAAVAYVVEFSSFFLSKDADCIVKGIEFGIWLSKSIHANTLSAVCRAKATGKDSKENTTLLGVV